MGSHVRVLGRNWTIQIFLNQGPNFVTIQEGSEISNLANKTVNRSIIYLFTIRDSYVSIFLWNMRNINEN